MRTCVQVCSEVRTTGLIHWLTARVGLWTQSACSTRSRCWSRGRWARRATRRHAAAASCATSARALSCMSYVSCVGRRAAHDGELRCNTGMPACPSCVVTAYCVCALVVVSERGCVCGAGSPREGYPFVHAEEFPVSGAKPRGRRSGLTRRHCALSRARAAAAARRWSTASSGRETGAFPRILVCVAGPHLRRLQVCGGVHSSGR